MAISGIESTAVFGIVATPIHSRGVLRGNSVPRAIFSQTQGRCVKAEVRDWLRESVITKEVKPDYLESE
jgi:hypothetical protein